MAMTIDGCALYFPDEKLPLEKVHPKGRSDKKLLRSATWFEYDTPDGAIRLNLENDDIEQHLRGFKGYVANLPNSGDARYRALELIARAKRCVGVILPRPISVD